MPARFNHTIIAASDAAESARFYRELLEADDAPSWGIFTNLQIADGVLLQLAEPPVDIQMQHYAFLVDDDHFDRAHAKVRAEGLDFAADPHWKTPGEINHEHGGRGFYVRDPAGHGVELLTRPYL